MESIRDIPPEKRVLISTAPYGELDPHPLRLVESAGGRWVQNPFSRRLKEDELKKLIPPFGVLIAGTEPITEAVISAAPHLRLIARASAGLDNVDLLAARARGIQVTYTPDAPVPAVAELTIGLMLCLLRHIPTADRTLREGKWHRFAGRRLAEMTVGIVGAGRIGTRVIKHLAAGFPGVRILANDLRIFPELGGEYGVRWVEKETLYRESDIITLHVPLTPLTRNLVTSREMKLMKPSAVIINTARGGIVDEKDLAVALRSKKLAGAAIDVFESEPYVGELARIPQCVLTCHMGSMSVDCRQRMELEAATEVAAFLKNQPLVSLVPDEEYLARSRR